MSGDDFACPDCGAEFTIADALQAHCCVVPGGGLVDGVESLDDGVASLAESFADLLGGDAYRGPGAQTCESGRECKALQAEAFRRGLEAGRLNPARVEWPKDNRAAMTALARLFPTMVRHGRPVPGTDPWEPEALVEWLNTSGEPTSGSRHAALFLLSVWNADDWCAFGLRVRRLPKGAWKGRRRIGRWDLNDAFASWDEKHRAAALAWMTNPFWP